MKVELFLIASFFFVVLHSCKKTATAKEDSYVIKVIEYKTNEPLPRAQIRLYRCSDYDIEFGCQRTSLYATRTTDGKGEYTITLGELNKADEGIVLSKAQYWDIGGGTGENKMEPEAWALIKLKANKNYPDTSLFQLETRSEFGLMSTQSFKAPKDSTVSFRLFGNELNEIKWTVFTKDPGCYLYCTYDTLAFGNLSLAPEKFERLSSSINY